MSRSHYPTLLGALGTASVLCAHLAVLFTSNGAGSEEHLLFTYAAVSTFGAVLTFVPLTRRVGVGVLLGVVLAFDLSLLFTFLLFLHIGS